MHGTRKIRLQRLAEAERLSREAHSDDVRALQAECAEAEQDGFSVREIARIIGRSKTQAHRIMCGLVRGVTA